MISCSSSRSSSSTVVPSVARIVPGFNWTVVVVVAVTTWRIPASCTAPTSTSAATTTPCSTTGSTSSIAKVGTTTIFVILFVFLFLSTFPYKKKYFNINYVLTYIVVKYFTYLNVGIGSVVNSQHNQNFPINLKILKNTPTFYSFK